MTRPFSKVFIIRVSWWMVKFFASSMTMLLNMVLVIFDHFALIKGLVKLFSALRLQQVEYIWTCSVNGKLHDDLALVLAD